MLWNPKKISAIGCISQPEENDWRPRAQAALLFELTPQGEFSFVDPGVAHLTGYNPTELHGQNWRVLFAPPKASLLRLAALPLDREHSLRLELRRRDGARRRVQVQLTPRRVNGRISGLLGCAYPLARAGAVGSPRRMPAQRKSDAALPAISRDHCLFNNSPVSLWEEDFSQVKLALDRLVERLQPSGATLRTYFQEHPQALGKLIGQVKILDVNRATLALYGARTKGELLGQLDKIVPPQVEDFFIEELEHIAAGRLTFDWLGKNRTLDDRLIDIHLHWSVVPGYERDLSKVIVAIEDITERRQAEAALRASEATLQGLINAIPEVLLLIDCDANVIAANLTAAEQLNQNLEELIGANLLRIGRPEQFTANRVEYADQAIAKNRPIFFQDRRGEKTLENACYPISGPDGEVIRLALFSRDISARLEAEANLSASEARYRTLVENLPVGVYRTTPSPANELLMANPAFVNMLGYDSLEELQQLKVDEIYCDPAERHEFSELALREGEVRQLERRLRRKDGRLMVGLVTARLVRAENGQPAYFDCTLIDITDRRLAEEKARRLAERIQAIARPAHQMRAILDQKELTRQMVQVWQETTQAYNTNLFLVEGDHLVLVEALSGYADDHPPLGYRLEIGSGIIGRVAQTQQPMMVQDTRLSQAYLPYPQLPHTRSELATPVMFAGRLLGVIDTQSTEPGAYDESDLQSLSVLADQLAVALENARLFGETNRRLQRLASLRAMHLAISSSFDQNVTLQTLLEQVTAQLGVDACDILLLRSHPLQLEYAAGRGFHTNALQYTRLRPGDGLAGQAVLERRTVHVENLSANPHGFNRSPLLPQEGFEVYYGVPLVSNNQVLGVLEVFNRSPLTVDQEWRDFLEMLATQGAIAIHHAELFNALEHANIDLTIAYDSIIEGWSQALDLRDHETEGHTLRVTELTLKLAQGIGVEGEALSHIRRGAMLHDIGKMGIPDSILHKAGPLSAEEWEVMRKHPEYAHKLLASAQFLRLAREIPYCHHEKWDGSGYPRGLHGEAIPLAARIFALADVYDALISDRPYRKAWSPEQARAHIAEQAGKHFDPEVTAVFLALLEEMGESKS